MEMGEHERVLLPDLRTPPTFCQYADGPCDQQFTGTAASRAVFLYPSHPAQIATTIEAAAQVLKRREPRAAWLTWKNFQTAGQTIFCAICKSMRFADTIIADVTTLNFNLLFEIGFTIGLNMPVIPIRDTSFIRDKRAFDELGLLDTVGYVDFQNSEELARQLQDRLPGEPLALPFAVLNQDAPLYVLKGHIDTEGAIRLMSTLKKSALRFRTFDVVETPRLSLQEARKQVGASLAVVANLLSQDRQGAQVHNARCALIAGMAMASGKTVVLLQEADTTQPIDYRDVVQTYKSADHLQRLLERPIKQVVSRLQDARVAAVKRPERLLERIDLGDVAAENEIRALRSYFVRTAQFNDAKRGNARLVVGRKGAGKTAIFYAVRDLFFSSRSHLVLDLKPEGHQFTKLREAVLSGLTPGLQEHTLTAFWNYILLLEIAQKIVDNEYSWAQRDTERRQRYEQVLAAFRQMVPNDTGDLSERLLRQVDRLTERYDARRRTSSEPLTGSELTGLLFESDIPNLDVAVASYLETKEEVWLLVDNLDKGWPIRGASIEDIMILRTLLEATRKLQRQLERRNVSFRCQVFLRNDIYEHLVVETPDKGKDTAIVLDWDDPEIFREILRRRIEATTELSGSFNDLWPMIFETHVRAQESFQYIIERTLMRPRDLLNFVHRCIEVAVNRGHERVLEDDILKAEEIYSDDMLLAMSFEIKDVVQAEDDALYDFLGCPTHLAQDEVLRRVGGKNKVLDLLVWFGFLGVQSSQQEEPRFAYQVRYNTAKLLAPLKQGHGAFVVHPAFRKALGCV